MSRLQADLARLLGDTVPKSVTRLQVAAGEGLEQAHDEADRLVDAGTDLVVLDSDITTDGARIALAVLLDLEPVAVVPSTAPDWRERVVATRTGVRGAREHRSDAPALLEHLDDPLLTRTAGLLERFADRRTPVLCGGGTTTAAAALVAARLCSGAERWWAAGSQPAEAAAVSAWSSLGLTPWLDLGLTTGSADVALAVLRAALGIADA